MKLTAGRLQVQLGLASMIGLPGYEYHAMAQSPPNTIPTFEETRNKLIEQAGPAVEAYLATAPTADPSTQRQMANYYCNYLADIPVKNASMVHRLYATSENCSTKGLVLLRRLAEKGDMGAQLQLAHLLNGFGSKLFQDPGRPPPDDAEAFKWYMAVAAEASSHQSNKSNPAKATAAGWLARFYEEGVFVPKNLAMAFHWYQIAANAGGDSLKLAEMLAKGEGTTKDPAEAIHLLISMPDNETAQLQLAEVYIFYDTTTPDRYEKARHILEPLHDRGKAPYYRHPASYYLGLLYFFGMGVQRNYRTAFDYLIDAARYGEPSAQKDIATLYLDGAGALQSYGDAYMWAAIAAANGNEEAISVRNAAEARMTRGEVEQARAKAAAWGNGGNSINYRCQTEPDQGWGSETWTVDFDRWRARWDMSREYDDVEIHGDDISIQETSGRVTAVINMKSMKYKSRLIDLATDAYYSKYGTCVISNK